MIGAVIDDTADAVSPGSAHAVEQLPPRAVSTATKVWEQCSENPGSKPTLTLPGMGETSWKRRSVLQLPDCAVTVFFPGTADRWKGENH